MVRTKENVVFNKTICYFYLAFCNKAKSTIARVLSKYAFFFFFMLGFSFVTVRPFISAAQGITNYGEITVTSTNFVDLNGRIASRKSLDNRGSIILPPFNCGNALTVNHIAGAVAPVTKTVNYGTVSTTLSGASKCWITQNLGADNQATSASDNTEAAAGWYWQFNLKQGYKHDGATRTPATAWNASISETSDWLPANDPCTLSLGSGWRIPTSTEWSSADANGGWGNYTNTYNSVLKLHPAGYLNYTSNGSLSARGAYGYYWGSTQANSTTARYLYFDNLMSLLDGNYKTYGFSLRCLKDDSPPVFTCGYALAVTHTLGDGVTPVTKTVNYGTVPTTLSGASKCWITQNLGADNQAAYPADASEASAGWYWQFNRKQGYKHDETSRTPATTWNASISETSDWLPANDPCTLSLGSGWRIPTSTEWTTANGPSGGNWLNSGQAYTSVLKLHAAGYLYPSDGSLYPRGTYGYYWSSTAGSLSIGRSLTFNNGGSGVNDNNKSSGFSVRCLGDNTTPFSCGNGLAVIHTAGTVAPVSKTVNYGTVQTNLSGASKCWITQNLGADHQASSATDDTEPSAGWYWQFNLKQGYKHTGATLTPGWTIPSGTDNSNWLVANDPCALLLGTGWRIPTSTEWTNADANGSWVNYTDTYNSVLKLHAAGYLASGNGLLYSRGAKGYFWSSTQNGGIYGWFHVFTSSTSDVNNNLDKVNGISLRCLKD